MFEELDHALGLLAGVVAELEPGCLDAQGAAEMVRRFQRGLRLGAAGKALSPAGPRRPPCRPAPAMPAQRLGWPA